MLLDSLFKKFVLFEKDLERNFLLEGEDVINFPFNFEKDMSFEQRFSDLFFNKFTTIIMLRIANGEMDKIEYINDNVFNLLEYNKKDVLD